MNLKLKRNSLAVSLFFMAWWFFGQLYEAFIYSPNWDSNYNNVVDKVGLFNSFMSVTSPMNYFTPFVDIGIILFWILFATNKDKNVRNLFIITFFVSLVAVIINYGFIIIPIATKMADPVNAGNTALLEELVFKWNLWNTIRVILIGIALYFLFHLYRKVDIQYVLSK